MSTVAVSRASWKRHVNAINPPRELRPWLTLPTSLSARLRAHSARFRVHPLRQQPDFCLPDEFEPIGLPRRCRIRVREVLLHCDNLPVVLARTIMPVRSTTSCWPGFRSLGAAPLGDILFGDPQVVRGELEFARLRRTHPLSQMANANFPGDTGEYLLYSRRCLFRRENNLMLVTEVFLPGITTLHTLADR